MEVIALIRGSYGKPLPLEEKKLRAWLQDQCPAQLDLRFTGRPETVKLVNHEGQLYLGFGPISEIDYNFKEWHPVESCKIESLSSVRLKLGKLVRSRDLFIPLNQLSILIDEYLVI